MSYDQQVAMKKNRIVRVVGSPVFLYLTQVSIGILFVMSSLIHFSGPYFFLESAARYQILDIKSLNYLLPLLTALQFVLGISLLVQFAPTLVLSMSGLLFTSFVVCQVSVLARGMSIDCGCYGSASHQIGVVSIATLLGLALICFGLVWIHHTNGNLLHHKSE